MTDPHSAPGFAPFAILTVCTGNICRSPLAAELLRARLGEAGLHGATRVASAGLQAVVGAPIDPIPAAISERLRGTPDGARARQLDTSIVNGSDLILTMTRDQRDQVVHRFPRALQRTFTLAEFTTLLALSHTASPLAEAVLADEGPPPAGGSFIGRESAVAATLRDHAKQLARIRSRAKLDESDDIRDPYRQSQDVHEAVGQQISLQTSHLAHSLAGWALDSAAEGTGEQ